jgi:hypothetical protein
MQKLLTTLAVLTAIVTPAFAQSFDPDAGTGNVLSFSDRPIVSQNDKITVRQGGIRAYAMAPRLRSAHHKEGAALNRNWGFARGICAIPEVNDPVGVWLPPQCER